MKNETVVLPELKPCPLCGSEAMLGFWMLPKHKPNENVEYFVICSECELRTAAIKIGKRDQYGNKRKDKISPIKAMQQASILWNSRVDDNSFEDNFDNGDREGTHE